MMWIWEILIFNKKIGVMAERQKGGMVKGKSNLRSLAPSPLRAFPCVPPLHSGNPGENTAFLYPGVAQHTGE
jgi:hypothetical protein